MFTTADLPESFRPMSPGLRARAAADRLGLRLTRHNDGCPRGDGCTCLLDAVVAVLDAVRPPT